MGRRANWSRYAWLVAFMTFVGALLRLYRLDAQSFWGDEALSALIADGSTSEVLGNTRASANPPGYYLLLHLWRFVAGRSDLAWRLPSALMGVMCIPLMYQLGRSFRGRQVGLWAAAMTTLAPFHVFYSQEARMYTQLHSLVCVLMLAYFRLWQRGQRRCWIWFFLASLAALWTHLFAAFVVALLSAHFLVIRLCLDHCGNPGLWFRRTTGAQPRWADYLVVNGGISVAFGLYLPHFYDQLGMIESALWRFPPEIGRLVGLPLALTISQFLRGVPQLMGMGLTLFLTIIVGMQIGRALWERLLTTEWLALLSLLCLVPTTGSFILSWVWRPVFAARYLIIALPAFYLLLAWSATETRERLFNQFLLVALLIMMIWGLHNWHYNVSFAKPPIRDAVQFVQSSGQSEAPVIHGIGASYRLFEHYAPDLENCLLSDSPTSHESEIILQRRRGWMAECATLPSTGFWYIVFPIHSQAFQSERRAELDGKFSQQLGHTARGIEVYYYSDADS